MNAFVKQWNLLSARLGVKPRQFAILSGVLSVAVFALGLRFAPRPAQKNSAGRGRKFVNANVHEPNSFKRYSLNNRFVRWRRFPANTTND